MPKPSKDDLEALAQGLPYIRSIMAFLIHLRLTDPPPKCYAKADEFIAQLKADLDAN